MQQSVRTNPTYSDKSLLKHSTYIRGKLREKLRFESTRSEDVDKSLLYPSFIPLNSPQKLWNLTKLSTFLRSYPQKIRHLSTVFQKEKNNEPTTRRLPSTRQAHLLFGRESDPNGQLGLPCCSHPSLSLPGIASRQLDVRSYPPGGGWLRAKSR